MSQTSEPGSVAPSMRRPPLVPPGEVAPNRWARLGVASLLAGRLVPMRRPPILVLSMPRSGSSWVGETLAASPYTAFLNEPFTHSLHVASDSDVVFEFESAHPPAAYRRAMAYVRAGVPAFGNATTRYGADWSLRRRIGRRLVVKDVNPLATGWFVQNLRPLVILVVRHPAAVAVSHERQGWVYDRFAEQFLPHRRAGLAATPIPSGFWAAIAALQAAATVTAIDELERSAAGRWRVVRYEDICRDPVGSFRDLYAFVGLEWTAGVEADVRARAAGLGTGDADDPYGTVRDSAAMADAWRSRIDPAALADVRAGWTAHHGPLYDADADWPDADR